jgi:hypothetical protein
MRSTVGALVLPVPERPSLTPYLLKDCHRHESDSGLMTRPDGYRLVEIIRQLVAA